MRIRVRWTALEAVFATQCVWDECPASIEFTWQLHNWHLAKPSALNWYLASEPFGCGGVLWQVEVWNHSSMDGTRQLLGRVKIVRIPECVNLQDRVIKCRLKCGHKELSEQTLEPKQYSRIEWVILNDTNAALEAVDTKLDLLLTMNIADK